MKLLTQLCFIFSICLAGELVCRLLPVGLPPGIVSMLLLFLLLLLHIVEADQIKETADFLLKNMSFFFIPAGINIMSYFTELKENLLPLIVICFISTILTFLATAFTVIAVSRLLNKECL